MRIELASAHFPKFALYRSLRFHELRKVKGTRKPIDYSAAFLFEVPGSNSPLVVQELQIGGTNAYPQNLDAINSTEICTHSSIDRIVAITTEIGMTEAGMGDLVNLKQFKKRARRDRAEQEAAANRARFGRTKSERALDELRASREADLLDQHRIDGEDAS